MHRPVLRLAACALTGAATVLVLAPAASADPAHRPSHELPSTSSAPLHAPPFTVPHGRKLS